MRARVSDKIFTVEEYIQHELKSPVRSEFINGQLFEMAGEKDINNEIAGNLYILFSALLRSLGYFIYAHDVKVKIFGENKYYYPDVFVTRELKTDSNKYIKSEPVLIVEVVSETSQVNDYVDKYIDYTKIPSLSYYLIVEPETTLVTCYKRGENNDWITSKYTQLQDIIKLDALEVSICVKEIYS
jgi:Uma2 family endonuclease